MTSPNATLFTDRHRNPQIQDICDFGYYALGKNPIAYHFTAFMLLANNIMLIGFHVCTSRAAAPF